MIRLLGSVLVWVSLALGAVSASTAYLAPTSLPDEAFQKTAPDGSTDHVATAAPHGPTIAENGAARAMFPKGTELTPDVLARMREPLGPDQDGDGQPDGPRLVERVKLDEFSFARWSHKWWFLLSVAGLLIGGLGPKLLAERLGPATTTPDAETPERTLDAIIAEVASLLADLDQAATDHQRLAIIVARVGELQQGPLLAFGESRHRLAAALGLAGYAETMDRFASAERALNRAWSAAADGHIDEAAARLSEAPVMLEAVRERLAAG